VSSFGDIIFAHSIHLLCIKLRYSAVQLWGELWGWRRGGRLFWSKMSSVRRCFEAWQCSPDLLLQLWQCSSEENYEDGDGEEGCSGAEWALSGVVLRPDSAALIFCCWDLRCRLSTCFHSCFLFILVSSSCLQTIQP
jgi:hypothetical protein